MSDLIDRIFAAVPRSEWAGGPAFTLAAALRDAQPMEPTHTRIPVRRPPVVLTCADCGVVIGSQAERCRRCAQLHRARERVRRALQEAA